MCLGVCVFACGVVVRACRRVHERALTDRLRVPTPPHVAVAQYNARPTTYEQAAPGIGSVFYAALTYADYVKAFGA